MDRYSKIGSKIQVTDNLKGDQIWHVGKYSWKEGEVEKFFCLEVLSNVVKLESFMLERTFQLLDFSNFTFFLASNSYVGEHESDIKLTLRNLLAVLGRICQIHFSKFV